MDKENNLIPSFFFSINEYLYIFGINSILTLNDFINTQSPDKISSITLLRIFSYGMFEYQKSIINSPDIAFNIISKILNRLKDIKPNTGNKVNTVIALEDSPRIDSEAEAAKEAAKRAATYQKKVKSVLKDLGDSAADETEKHLEKVRAS